MAMYYTPQGPGQTFNMPIPQLVDSYSQWGPQSRTTAVDPQPMAFRPVMNWVPNKSVVDLWPLAPGEKAAFFDSNNPLIYIKEVDRYGKPLPIVTYRMVLEEGTTIQEENAKAIDVDYDKVRQIVAEEIEKFTSQLPLKEDKPKVTAKKQEVK